MYVNKNLFQQQKMNKNKSKVDSKPPIVTTTEHVPSSSSSFSDDLPAPGKSYHKSNYAADKLYFRKLC